MNVLPINRARSTESNPASADHQYMNAAPFENNRDSRYYYPSSTHDEALSRLSYLAEDGNFTFGVLSGYCGSGKTYIRTLFHSRLDKDRYISVVIENSLLDLDGLLLEIISQMRGRRCAVSEFPDRYSRIAEFKKCLQEDVAGYGRHLVMTFDEAHLLDTNTLEGIRSLTNINSPLQNLITVLLVGQAELEGKLTALPALDQRIGLRIRLSKLDLATSISYIKHRLNIAGISGRLSLSAGTYEALYKSTEGIPRKINNLLKLTIEFARINNTDIDDAALATVIRDQSRVSQIERDIHQGLLP